MKKHHKDRLRKLIAFLPTIPRKNFDFNEVVREVDDEHKCGTVCCAIGWTPSLFPRLVKWTGSTDWLQGIKLTGAKDHSSYAVVAEELFGISRYVANNLFSPASQEDVDVRLKNLPINATPKQVAKMLQKFLDLVEAGEIEA